MPETYYKKEQRKMQEAARLPDSIFLQPAIPVLADDSKYVMIYSDAVVRGEAYNIMQIMHRKEEVVWQIQL